MKALTRAHDWDKHAQILAQTLFKQMLQCLVRDTLSDLVTHLAVYCLSGDLVRDEGSLVGHVGIVCILPKVYRSVVSRPAHCHHVESCNTTVASKHKHVL